MLLAQLISYFVCSVAYIGLALLFRLDASSDGLAMLDRCEAVKARLVAVEDRTWGRVVEVHNTALLIPTTTEG